MSIKEAMKKYFQMRIEVAAEGLDFLFKTPVNNDDDLIIYEGKVDEEEYISWKPLEMTVSQDFETLEIEFEIKLHNSGRENVGFDDRVRNTTYIRSNVASSSSSRKNASSYFR